MGALLLGLAESNSCKRLLVIRFLYFSHGVALRVITQTSKCLTFHMIACNPSIASKLFLQVNEQSLGIAIIDRDSVKTNGVTCHVRPFSFEILSSLMVAWIFKLQVRVQCNY